MKKSQLKKIIFVTVLWLVSSALSATEKYALIVGTNYKGSTISPLELCERDAERMKEQIVKTGNFKSANVKVFLGAQVTRENLRASILDWLAKQVKEGDQVFFYFAGHGQFFRDSSAKNGMRNFIIMYNRPHISDDELSQWFSQVKTKKAVIILDCCFSGGIAKKGQAVRGNGSIPIPEGSDSVVLQDLEGVFFQNKVVISSSDDNETAIELSDPINHGVFTYFFSEAILRADLNNDQIVTAYEAFYKARNDTIKTAAKVNHKQTPQISGDASGFFFVGNYKPADEKKNQEKKEEKLPPHDIKPDEKEKKKDPPINEDEPENKKNTKTGTLVLDTTYRSDILKGSTPAIFVNSEKVAYRLKWVQNPSWGNVAMMQVQNIPTGVHNITIQAKGYPDKIIKTGIEEGQTTVEKIPVSISGRGSITGKVWLETFDRPVPNIMVFLKPIRIPGQPTVRTDADGSFTFNELKPGEYTVFLRGGKGVYSKPYDQRITVDADRVTQIDVVLKEFFKQ